MTVPLAVPIGGERGGSVGAPTGVDNRSGACPSTGKRDDGMGVENPAVDGEMSTAVSGRSRGGTHAMPTIDGDGRSSGDDPGREGPGRDRRSSATSASASDSSSDRVARSSEIAAALSSASSSRASSSCSSGPPASAPRRRTRRLANITCVPPPRQPTADGGHRRPSRALVHGGQPPRKPQTVERDPRIS